MTRLRAELGWMTPVGDSASVSTGGAERTKRCVFTFVQFTYAHDTKYAASRLACRGSHLVVTNFRTLVTTATTIFQSAVHELGNTGLNLLRQEHIACNLP